MSVCWYKAFQLFVPVLDDDERHGLGTLGLENHLRLGMNLSRATTLEQMLKKKGRLLHADDLEKAYLPKNWHELD